MRGISLLSRPTADIIRNIGRIHRQEIRFILEPTGPTKFHLKQIYPITSRSGTVYTVSIGSAQLCTCGSREICVHILYVMMRYFGVPKDSELLYQRSLSDGEIDSLFERRYIQRARSHTQQTSPSRNRAQNNNNNQVHQYNPPPQKYIFHPPRQKVNRIKISEDDLCPICYDSLFDCPPEEVAWCSFGCGGNFHLRCVQEWIRSQNSDGKPGSCPLCRVEMEAPDTSTAPNQKEFNDIYHQQLLLRQKHESEEAKSEAEIFHSNDTTASKNQQQRNTVNNNNQNETNNNNNNASGRGSYLAMLRREMEASSQSRDQIQQQIQNQERTQNNNNNNNENINYSMSELAAQIREIDDFLSAARSELDNEMNRLKEHQRRVQATIEAQIKAGARARSGLKDSRGRNVEPVLKVRVPIFDSSTANQQSETQRSSSQLATKQKPRPLQRMTSPPSSKLEQTTSNSQRNNETQNNIITKTNDQATTKTSRTVVTAHPVVARRIIRNEMNQQPIQIQTINQDISHPSIDTTNTINDIHHSHSNLRESSNSLHSTQLSPITETNETTSSLLDNNASLNQQKYNLTSFQSPPRSPPSPMIAKPSISSSSSLFTSQTQIPSSQTQISSSQTQIPSSQTQISSSQTQIPSSQTQSISSSSSLLTSQTQIPSSQTQISSSQTQIPSQTQSISSSSSLLVSQTQIPTLQTQTMQTSSSLSSLPPSSPFQPSLLLNSSSSPTVPDNNNSHTESFQKPPRQQEKHQSRLCSLIDEYCSLESYEEERPPQSSLHHQPISHQHQQTIPVRSSLNSTTISPIDKIDSSNQNEKRKLLTMKPVKTVNLNDTFNDLTAPRGNITDGLTLAHQQARENEQRFQRTLNPNLIPKGLSAKRAAKSRLQPKRAQNGQAQQHGKRKMKLGWSS